MQPLPSFNIGKSSVAYAAILGILITGTSQSIVHLQTDVQTSLTKVAHASTDDDRGSGRVAGHPPVWEPLSFRGSGRISPDPSRSSETSAASFVKKITFDPDPNYRGSGRLG